MELAGAWIRQSPRLTTFQGLNILTVEREPLQIGKPWRIAEYAQCKVVRKPAQPVDVVRICNVSLRLSMYVNSAK